MTFGLMTDNVQLDMMVPPLSMDLLDGKATGHNTEFLCVAVYEAYHYHGFIVYIRATSPRHVWCSKPLVVLSVLHGHRPRSLR